MIFLLKEIFKSFKPLGNRKRVGFVVSDISSYNRVTASTRIRVYDLIRAFEGDASFRLELFRSWGRYDIVIFLKAYDKAAYQLAEKLQSRGTKVIFDININIFESGSMYVTNLQREEGIRFATLSNTIITNSPHTESILKKLFPDKGIHFIEEAIHGSYFQALAKKPPSAQLVWVGYKHKAEALLLIKEVLLELFEKYPFNIKVICEENPTLDFGKIPVVFRTYRHKYIVKELSEGTVFIAPRDLSDTYNMGHSFTKIGTAMAVGLPVVASPLPAYQESPALICNTKEEWRNALTSILEGTVDLEELKKKGKTYCQDYYGIKKIKGEYRNLFNSVVTKDSKA